MIKVEDLRVGMTVLVKLAEDHHWVAWDPPLPHLLEPMKVVVESIDMNGFLFVLNGEQTSTGAEGFCYVNMRYDSTESHGQVLEVIEDVSDPR